MRQYPVAATAAGREVPLSVIRHNCLVNRFERLLDSHLGWIIPGGAPFKLGRKDGADRTMAGSWLIWGVYGARMYERGRRKTIAGHAGE